ncbi:MAG: ABC transporter ATP-binding protein [Spirochaetes bacterium]|nr:MAG: ABC transporter ATP-binding protein [Spirochaetota bacterium]
MIEVKNLGKKYGNLEAVKGVTFTIGRGEIVGLLGPNGAGKTTIMKILTGYHYPSYGEAFINNYNIYTDTLEVKKSIGYLPENTPLYADLTVYEYLDFISHARGLAGEARKEHLDRVMEECAIGSVVYKEIDKLSKGYCQRVGLAQAILHNPGILILDEPTTGLDPNQIMEIRKLIKKLGEDKTVIISTHILQEVEAVCNRVLILNEGLIVAEGATDEIGREMKGDSIYVLTIKGSDIRKAEKSLSSLTTIKTITEARYFDNDKATLRISISSDVPGGELLFDWAVKEGYKILEMTPKHLSLEDVFVKLTTEEGVR